MTLIAFEGIDQAEDAHPLHDVFDDDTFLFLSFGVADGR
jgi:hypothetical protein